MLKVGDVFTGVRALLNDQDNAVYTNTVQLEYFKIAYEEIRQACEDHNIPITNKTSSAIMIPVGTTDIGGPTGPALPADLIEVLECWEIPAGTNNDYMLMRRLNFLPKTAVLTSYLEVYQWAEQYIHFLGANGNIQVKIDYVATGMPDVNDANSIVKLKNAVNFLKYKTAALCTIFIDENETRASILSDLSIQAYDTLMGILIKNSQGISTRRRPFMANYKNRAGVSGR